MTRKEKQKQQRHAALVGLLSSRDAADSESLSRSYNLPENEVQRLMRNMGVINVHTA